MSAARPWPVELRLAKDKTTFTVSFDTGETFALAAEYLRVESPSAEVQGHSIDQKLIIGGKRHVTITDVEPVGNYAVRLRFDDGHDTGLYSWDYLHELGATHAEKWAAYLAALRARRLDR